MIRFFLYSWCGVVLKLISDAKKFILIFTISADAWYAQKLYDSIPICREIILGKGVKITTKHRHKI